MIGTYISPAIPPWCEEKRTPAKLIQWRGDRCLLVDLEMEAKGVCYLIDASIGSFEPTIPPEGA